MTTWEIAEKEKGKMQKNWLEVNILGSSFTIQSENDPLYLGEVIEYLNIKIDEINKEFSINDPLKISLLAALNLVDELFKTKKHINPGEVSDSVEITKITEQLINKIDESLLEH